MRNLLYLMHVPWGWIKQRPHFLAEGLAEHYRTELYYYRSYRQSWLVANRTTASLAVHPLWVVPFGYLSRLNSALIYRQVKRPLAVADILWITHPYQYGQLAGHIPQGCRVVYDCMDDLLNLSYIKNHAGRSTELAKAEKELVARSDLVLVSAENLRRLIAARYGRTGGVVLINNAVSLEREATAADTGLPPEIEAALAGAEKTVAYIGTLSEWFDWGLVLESLERNPGIRYLLVGPAYGKIPEHSRLHYSGPVEHRHVFPLMARADALVMPFVHGDLIRSVDPVKLYEYVASGRPVVALRYGESEKFADYTHLYGDRAGYLELMDQVAAGTLLPKQEAAACLAFGRSNSWPTRVAAIVAHLERLF